MKSENFRACVAVVAGLAMTQGAAAQHKYQSWIKSAGGDISDTELMKAVRDRGRG